MDEFVSKEFSFILTKSTAISKNIVERLADDLLEGKSLMQPQNRLRRRTLWRTSNNFVHMCHYSNVVCLKSGGCGGQQTDLGEVPKLSSNGDASASLPMRIFLVCNDVTPFVLKIWTWWKKSLYPSSPASKSNFNFCRGKNNQGYVLWGMRFVTKLTELSGTGMKVLQNPQNYRVRLWKSSKTYSTVG